MTIFLKVENIEIYMDRIWRWRHRSWPEAEKSSAPYNFSVDYNKKRIRLISLTGFEKKIQNCPPLKKISTLDNGKKHVWVEKSILSHLKTHNILVNPMILFKSYHMNNWTRFSRVFHRLSRIQQITVEPYVKNIRKVNSKMPELEWFSF